MLTLSVIIRELLLKLPDANLQRARCRRALDWIPWGSKCRSRVTVRSTPLETEMTTGTDEAAIEGHVRIIQTHYSRLLNSITSVEDIIVELFQTENLTSLELEYLQSFESTPIRASTELLNIIMKKSREVYETFLTTLKNARQHDAYRVLTTNSPGQHLIYSDHYCAIRQHYDWLTKNMASDTGLIPLLFEMGVLTNREYECIGSKTSQFKKNEALLSTVSRKSSEDFIKFQQALIETGQSHVVEELKYSPAGESNRPRHSYEHRFLIQRYFCWLAETIDSKSGLIELLYQNKVISFRERETINSERDAIKTNESLINIISQKSATEFEQFQNALIEMRQGHVVHKLFEEIPKIEVENMERNDTKKVFDKQISDPKSLQKKTWSISSLKTNFEKLEIIFKLEILMKAKNLRQHDTDTSRNVFQGYLQKILGDSHDRIMELKRLREEEKRAIIQERELEKEKLNSKLQLKKSLTEEEKLRRESEDQNKKINEMYGRMKAQFEQQEKRFQEEYRSYKCHIETLSCHINKEKVLKEKTEHDLLQTQSDFIVMKDENYGLKITIEKYKNDITAADKRTLQLHNILHLFKDQLRSFSVLIPSCFGLETERLSNAMQKIMDLEKTVKCVAEKITSNKKMEISAVKRFEEELRETKSELKSMNEDKQRFEEELQETRSDLVSVKEEKQRLEIAIKKCEDDLEDTDERSQENVRFAMKMLHILDKSTNDCFCFEADRLAIAVKKIMDLGTKLSLIEESIVLLRRKLARSEMNKEVTNPPLSTHLSALTAIRDSRMHDILREESYPRISRVIEKPVASTRDFREFWIQVLPYLTQRIKMWNCDVISPQKLNTLVGVQQKPSSSFSRFIKMGQESSKPVFPVSRLHCIDIILNAADTVVEEDILRIMSKFPLTLPLIIPDIDQTEGYIVTIPYIQNFVIEWESNSGKVVENHLFTSPFSMVFALRHENNKIGKSTILNQLMRKQHMFSSRCEPGAKYGRPLTLDGSVEMLWLTQETCSDITWESLMRKFYKGDTEEEALLENLHSDALEHLDIVKFIATLAQSFFVFIMPDASEDRMYRLHKLISHKNVFSLLVDPPEIKIRNKCSSHRCIDQRRQFADSAKIVIRRFRAQFSHL